MGKKRNGKGKKVGKADPEKNCGRKSPGPIASEQKGTFTD